MEAPAANPGPGLRKDFVRAALYLLFLLVFRSILDSLPFLKNASVIGDTLLSPLVLVNAVIDTISLSVVLSFGLTGGRQIHQLGHRYTDLSRIISLGTIVIVLVLAYRVYELPVACTFVNQSDLVNLSATTQQSPGGGGFGDFIRLWGQMIGQVSAAALQNANGQALLQYQRLALALFHRSPDLYAWIFSILIGIPVVTLVTLVYRNLDNLSELLSHGILALQTGALPPVDSSRVPAVAEGAAATANGPGAGLVHDGIERLTKLKSLYQAGAISEADFVAQKPRIIASMIEVPSAKPEMSDFLRLKELSEASILTPEEYASLKDHFLKSI